MRMIVVPPDNFVAVDGHGLQLPITGEPADVRAYRFDNATAIVEFMNGHNEALKNSSVIKKKYLELWKAAKAAADEEIAASIEAERQRQAAEAEAAKATPAAPSLVSVVPNATRAVENMTDEEVEQLEAAYDASARFRMVWDDPTPFTFRYDAIKALLVPVFGEDRTVAILQTPAS